ncbi:DUF6233 domain-containing protein [Streptomyces olivochromogenes]|uniref:DUF6233 domain-containing protein n=1 Tax=Streptomyces olivochromogenes TaxID=1963 RepID=UPI001F210707|nr:DUF6233 domain-containing protein [Streptomyces olivochromogenes]MCF3131655.1 hypothetical protein [Streptomyces olivochromogenes]
MTDESPSRLELLHFARRVVIQQAKAALAQLDRWIAEEQRREAERRRGEEMRPPPPEWLIERGLDKKNLVAVHAGGCWQVTRSGRCVGISRTQALDALRRQVPACKHCRPDTALGFLE